MLKNIKGKFDVRLYIIFSLLLIVAAVVSINTTSVPEHIWINIYHQYSSAWIFLMAVFVVASLMVIYSDVSWPIVILIGVCSGVSISLISLQWGLPFTSHDVWVQLSYAREGILSGPQNPYPALHSLSIILAEILGLSQLTIFTYGIVVVIMFGIVAFSLPIRSISRSRQSGQLTFLVGVPSCLYIFSVRPISLAWPFIFVIIWLLYNYNTDRRFTYLLISSSALVFHHPQLIIFTLVLLFIINITQIADKKFLYRIINFNNINIRTKFVMQLFAVTLLLYLIYIVSIFDKLSSRVIVTILFGDSLGAASRSSAVGEATTGFSAIIEALQRSLFVISVGIAVVLSQLQEFREKTINTFFISLRAWAGIIFSTFVIFDLVLQQTVLNINRALMIIPGIGLITAIKAFNSHKTISITLAVMIVISGLIVAYPSDYIGSNRTNPTDSQVSSIEWVDGFRATQMSIIPSGTSFWIATGTVGSSSVQKWYDRERDPTRAHIIRSTEYSWQVSKSSSALYIIDEREVQKAGIRSSDWYDNKYNSELRNFVITNGKIYSNGESRMYINRS